MPDYSRRSGHPQLRAALLARYVPGVTVCWRCQQPITTLRLRDIHLGHDDDNPAIWRGLEHAACNIHEGAKRGAAITNARKAPGHGRRMVTLRTRRTRRKQSRTW